jgi:hypothetical protein
MNLHHDSTNTFTMLELLFVLLLGLAPLAVTLWVKVMLSRRRTPAEDHETSPRRHTREAHDARERHRRRRLPIRRSLPREFEPSRPLGLYIASRLTPQVTGIDPVRFRRPSRARRIRPVQKGARSRE